MFVVVLRLPNQNKKKIKRQVKCAQTLDTVVLLPDAISGLRRQILSPSKWHDRCLRSNGRGLKRWLSYSPTHLLFVDYRAWGTWRRKEISPSRMINEEKRLDEALIYYMNDRMKAPLSQRE